MTVEDAASGNQHRGGRTSRGIRRVLGLLAFLLVLEYLVLPQLAGTRKAIHLLGRIQPAWVAAGFLLEAAALGAYAQLTRSLLPRVGRPSLGTLARIQLSTLAVSHVVPAGSAAGTGLGYDLMTRSGVRGPDAGFALGAQGLGSAIVLNLLLWVGLVVSIPVRGFNPLYVTAAVVGVVLMAAFAAAVLSLTLREARTTTVLRAVVRRMPFFGEESVQRIVHQLADRLRQLGGDRNLLIRAAGWALTNWLLDLASLWVFLTAFGGAPALDAILVAYGLANVLGAIPVTPGGLGIIEGVLIPTLVGFGSPRGIALLGVAAWRLVNFWLPIPVGAVAYLSLRAKEASTLSATARLGELAERAAREGRRRKDPLT
ncbi:MAG: lysylphosphatidylglycerol synthase transmembrane domain-containing protein [Acidimicrobiales bacterium]